MKADLDKGVKLNEALGITLTEADRAKYRIQNRRTIARFLQKYLKGRKLPYTLNSFRQNGEDFFIIENGPRP
jgi:hypothetical protein